MMTTVAELIVDGLLRAGTRRLFGVPASGSNVEILEAARRGGLPVVLCHQESAACIMAAVTGELTDHPGAALSSLGAGVTASATGLAHAFLDRSPMIFLSDRHSDAALAFTTHQRVDHAALLAPIVKGSATVTADSVHHWVAHAAQLALKDPRGPVHLDLPADLAGRPALPMAANFVPPSLSPPDTETLDRAATMILGARRPVVVAGLQCRSADAKWLRAFCEALPAPLLTTGKAKGAIPDPHPLSMGLFTGGAWEEPVVRRADLIITFGLDPVELMPRPWPYTAPVLALSRCASSELALGGGAAAPTLELVGDLGSMLEELAPRLVGRYLADWDVGEVERWRRERVRALQAPVPGLAPHRVVEVARELTPAGTIATVDAGAHALAVTAHWQAVEPGELLISNGLAPMGFALPAAVAAQLVYPERRVICFTGHGGFMMIAAELGTAARLRLPIVIVVLDDGARSLDRMEPAPGGDEGPSMRHEGPDLAALARAFGVAAFVAADERTFTAAWVSALRIAGPTLIDARIGVASGSPPGGALP